MIIDDPLMRPICSTAFLYFTDSGRYIVGRVPIHPDGSAADNLSIVMIGSYGDIFTFGTTGILFIADALDTLDPRSTL